MNHQEPINPSRCLAIVVSRLLVRPGCDVICKSFTVSVFLPYFGEGKANKYDSNLLYLCNVRKKQNGRRIYKYPWDDVWCIICVSFY